MTSDLTPSAAPTNIIELRAKNPEPTHPDRDPIIQPALLSSLRRLTRCVVGGSRRARVHSAALQYQAHCQVLLHTLAGVSGGH
jgi:hypothetical protein